MLTLIKRALAAAIVMAAMALPTAAYARVNETPISSSAVPVEPAYTSAGPDTDQPAATSSAGFRWGDAGIGAGSLPVLIGVGAGAAVVVRRRAHRPLAS
jgi:hypothetical protein